MRVNLRTGSCGKYHPTTNTTDGHNYHCCSTAGRLKDMRPTTTTAWRLARCKLKDKYWACQAYAVLEIIGMVDETGMKKEQAADQEVEVRIREARRAFHPSK
eukprot:8897755-Pyramimonas_sp.AAC.1